MYRPLSIFIGTRYTRAKRRNQFISFISLTSMIGMGLGVLAMIVVLSVMNGLQEEMRTRILGMIPHATLSGSAPLRDWQQLAQQARQNPQVLAAAPHTEIQGMLSRKGVMQPVLVSGVLPEAEEKVSILAEHMQRGSLAALKPGAFGILLGETSARRFGVQVGDKVSLIVPEATKGSATITPRLQSFTLVGVFKVGAELDSSLALIHVADAAQLKRWPLDQVQSVRLTLQDLYQAPQVAAQIASGLGQGFSATDWTKTQGSLFQAMQMEKTMIALLLLLIIAVAAFNIVSTLIMVVADKRTDIAILRTLGMTPQQVMAVFMVQGSVIGLVGVLTGGVLGVLLALNLTPWVSALENLLGARIFSGDLYYISYLPSLLEWRDVLLVCSAGLLLSFLATLLPAWRASRTPPAEAMRYE
ncbi:lipoprotein-releasing ABC transporter permease subunit [Pseudomonas sp. N040]|uniref:lipoprotein-releasing ABC transporter permease subunit n=1 Tax=Pseudomonas sp. N040 TaxID=2785325 RepID=UPI0018A33A83|nr:lipoprotein-releasing ABC transporter permease subunit [Pseudomonas sp. N040]MBF7731332.1 lipoprotein-releasing ABC transporter permease subunit [Pseudomonas sp. N040]MBW7014975.1 lipoprotein-releasing ABC transporter permease subunit [Pseudomonas sp. N040]